MTALMTLCDGVVPRNAPISSDVDSTSDRVSLEGSNFSAAPGASRLRKAQGQKLAVARDRATTRAARTTERRVRRVRYWETSTAEAPRTTTRLLAIVRDFMSEKSLILARIAAGP